MGINIDALLYLQEKGHLTSTRNRLLDIGPQTVYFATAGQIRQFVAKQGLVVAQNIFESEVERLVYFSTPRPGERTTFLSEVTDLTNVEYHSFDVCPALKTEILDLNFDPLPAQHREYHDVILNSGTTEHIFNQWNCFEVMHDAAKVGGVIYCQLPASGYLDHGYFCYTPLFFRDLAAANGYELLDIFVTLAGLNDVVELGIDTRGDHRILSPRSIDLPPHDRRVPCFNIHVVMRKTKSAPFRCVLEVATRHADLDTQIAERYEAGAAYGSGWRVERDHLIEERDRLAGELAAFRRSTSWRLTAPLRYVVAKLRGGRAVRS